MQKIFVYLNSLIICMLALSVEAQTPQKTPEVNNVPFFNGITIQADVASVLSPLLSNGVSYSYEAGAQVDLKHKIFPVVELGFAGADKTSNDNIGFKTNGLFGRLGVDFNLIKSKKDEKQTSNLFLVGLRLGMTSFKYSLSNVNIIDDYWGGTYPVDYSNLSSGKKLWYEIVAGVRVEVVKNVFMGWSVRIKNLLSQDVPGAVTPWYIPGFGTTTGSNLGFNYTIGYKFQLPPKTKKTTTIKETEVTKETEVVKK